MAALDDATQWRVLFQFSQELLSIVVGEHGLKCVATRDIAARQVILVEPPVATFDMNPFGQGAQFMARPDVQALQQEIMRCASANAGREGTDAYPVEAREAIEDIVALSATVQLASLDAATVDRVFAFEDSFRTAIAGEHVCVDGGNQVAFYSTCSTCGSHRECYPCQEAKEHPQLDPMIPQVLVDLAALEHNQF